MRKQALPTKIKLPWILRLTAPRRLAIVVACALATYLLLRDWLGTGTRLLLAWDVGALAYLCLAAMVVARADDDMTRVRAQMHDQNGYVIFLLVMTAASASFVAIGFLAGGIKALPFWPRAGYLTLTVAALLLSWLLIQTLFAFHYARLYYARPADAKVHQRGLKFPDEGEPDYLDFAYYAFVVGMTSQVSDVAVMARHMRRLTLIHGILSFVFNITILAMSINIIGSLL
ncbi:MAG TPA: DUF1345 domain-containing protein [Casimicrobiaceae bacterium]|jgi:uncharacterized membrane protein